MSKFFIGCRVKKVRGNLNIGSTGVVVGLEFLKSGIYENHPLWGLAYLDEPSDIQVRHDSFWQSKYGSYNPPSLIAADDQNNWEPIVPEGQVASNYSFHELIESLEEQVSDTVSI